MRKSRSGCFRWVIIAVAGGVLLYIFRYELRLGMLFVRSLLSGQIVEGVPELARSMKITLFITENALAAFFFVILILYWVAGSAFPVNDNRQVTQIMQRMISTALGRVTPLLQVRDGVLVGEVSRISANLLLVDLNSAVVIERQNVGAARIGSPGLVFLRSGERLRDVVSLRNYIRTLQDVRGQTSDGIELSTDTYAVFTLGQPPDVIQVAYMGDETAQNLCLLQIGEKSRRIVAIYDELDPLDKDEIHNYAQNFLYYLEPNSQLEVGERSIAHPPYQIDDQRIFSAVYSQARDVTESGRSNRWTDMPALVAAEVFRNMIARFTLDDLYKPEDPNSCPLLDEIKPEFERQIRLLGLISYQFVQRNDGEPPQIDQRVDHRNFRIAAVQELRGSKVLRERGIKVIRADFTELNPTDPQVNQQRIENWRARWQKEADIIRADMDFEVIRIRNQARADRQREMIEQLSNLMKSSAYSEEALSLRIFQILEEMAADPATRQFLPRDAFGLLKSLRLDLSTEKESGSRLLDQGAAEEKSE